MSQPLYAIHVEARPAYLEEHSTDTRYAFAYHITITNVGRVAVRLISRHWIIRDGAERVEEVRGEGVVGEQPHLEPGASFEYVSGCTLTEPVGTMEGSYFMLADDGTEFEALIAPFVLAVPRTLH
ncbi:Co2+/Mg2+ efflux protein ApaG [Chitinibacteraceae bacterium HSL-7]